MKKFIFYILIFLTNYSFAQIYNNGAIISIQERAELYSPVTIQNNGYIANKGSIILEADWLNYASYDTTGTLVLSGQNAQNIIHNSIVFKALVVNGNGNKFINSNVSIMSELSLINGILTVVEDNIFILEKNAISTNSSDISFVDGLLFNSGEGYKLYPVGRDNIYSPVELINVNNDVVAGVQMFYPNIKLDAEAGLDVSESRYYELIYLSGNDIKSKLTIPYDETFSEIDFDNLVVVQANEGEEYQSLGNDLSGGLNIDGVTSLSVLNKQFFTLALLGIINVDLFIPSALSSNATNENDRRIKIYGDDFTEENFSFQVYNKWGNLIYSTTSLQEMKTTGWSGTNQKTGEQETTGMFSYIIKAKSKNGEEFNKAGTIMIIR